MSPVIALLRAVNVGGRTVTSAVLRTVAQRLGHGRVVTHLASGNLVLVPPAGAGADEVAAGLSAALAAETGFDVPVLARDLAAWDALVDALPLPEEAAEDPSHLVLCCFAGPVAPGADGALDRTRLGSERVVWHEREAYVHYPDGIGTSKLTLDVLSRAAGQVGTGRNWRTVLALQRLARERAD